jgi:acetyl esterase/lipase
LEHFDIDGLPAAWISPSDAESSKVILHFHGGGYVTGGIESHLMMCIPMAQALRMKILLFDYRLAPENPFPAALKDGLKMYRWLLEQGYQANNLILSGDSAGGGLALATTLSLRDSNEPLPSAVICISPWIDLAHAGESHATNSKADVVLTTDVLTEWASVYTDESKLRNPLVSPLYADFHGFPPLFIQADSSEILLDDAKRLADKARAYVVDVTLKIWDGMWHAWHALGDLIPESKKAFEEIGQFLNAHKSEE